MTTPLNRPFQPRLQPAAPAVTASPQQGPSPRLKRDDTFTIDFGPETTKGIDELAAQLDGNPSRTDVVFTALQLLLWALDQELIVESPSTAPRQRVSDLWKHPARNDG
jgi:hypothetical protein